MENIIVANMSLEKHVYCILVDSIRDIPVASAEIKRFGKRLNHQKSHEICECEMAVLILKRRLVGSIQPS